MRIRNLVLAPELVALIALFLPGHLKAQTFTTLHSFTATSGPFGEPYANGDGANPNALILSGTILYGTAALGGSSGGGTVFAARTDGTGFTNLHSFNWGGAGSYPQASLILSGNTLFGTAYYGGSSSNGTVFSLNTNGSGFTNLHSFKNSDGANPSAGLLLSGHTLYGTAQNGGNAGNGTVFALKQKLTKRHRSNPLIFKG